MRRSNFLLVGLLLILLSANGVLALTPTIIENADGKKVAEMEDPTSDKPYLEVTLAGHDKPSVYVHEGQILTDTSAPPLFVVDDNDVRHTSAGVKLANFDGDNIRHGRSVEGKVLMNYHHPDLCPTAQANRVYLVTGPQLTKPQLVAVLYALNPDMFKLTDEERSAQEKAMAEAGAEADKLAAADQLAGKWMVLNGTGPVEKIGNGTITFSPKKGDAYPVNFDHTQNGGPSWAGVAVYLEAFGDKNFWAAYGTPKTVGMCVYAIDGGTLTGKWYPWYIDGEAKNVGTENLKGPDTLDGDFTITDAKAPTTGAAYTGTVTIKPLTIVGAGDDEKPYSVTWNFGTTKVQGIGIRTRKFLYVSSGSGADVNIGKFKIDNGSFTGDFYKLGSDQQGSTSATTSN